MDHQMLRDEQHSQPASLPMTHELTRAGRAVTAPAVTTPMSLARRCDHIIGLIDDLPGAPATCGDTADVREKRRCRESPPTSARHGRARARG